MRDQVLWSLTRILITIGFMLILQLLLVDVDPYIVLFLNLFMIMLLDPLDSIPMRMKYGDEWSTTSSYQVSDKIGDVILEAIALILHLYRTRDRKDQTFEIIFSGLFIYRLIGVILYSLTDQAIFLVIFPNFFLENVMLYLFLAKIMHLNKAMLWTLIGISIPLKIIQEYIHHMIISKPDI